MRPLWYLSNHFLGAWPRLSIHRASSTEGTPLIAGGAGRGSLLFHSPGPDHGEVKTTFQACHQKKIHNLKCRRVFLLLKGQLGLFCGSATFLGHFFCVGTSLPANSWCRFLDTANRACKFAAHIPRPGMGTHHRPCYNHPFSESTLASASTDKCIAPRIAHQSAQRLRLPGACDAHLHLRASYDAAARPRRSKSAQSDTVRVQRPRVCAAEDLESAVVVLAHLAPRRPRL